MKNNPFMPLVKIPWRTPTIIFFGFILVFVVYTIDYAVGYEISFSIFYLFPILFITLLTNHRIWIFIFCVFSAVAWLIADITAGKVYSTQIIPFWNMLVRLAFFIIISLLVFKQKNILEKERERSMVDSMTNVGNSRYFYEACKKEIQRATRYGKPMTFVYFDVDDFKQVNDRFGHLRGDSLLKTIASTAKVTIRETDILGRLGGDEFAVLLPEISFEQANWALERLQTALLNVARKENYPVTFSFGMATFHKPLASVDAMIKTVDELMYKGKEDGKNKINTAVY